MYSICAGQDKWEVNVKEHRLPNFDETMEVIWDDQIITKEERVGMVNVKDGLFYLDLFERVLFL
jgi:hypothetical protein